MKFLGSTLFTRSNVFKRVDLISAQRAKVVAFRPSSPGLSRRPVEASARLTLSRNGSISGFTFGSVSSRPVNAAGKKWADLAPGDADAANWGPSTEIWELNVASRPDFDQVESHTRRHARACRWHPCLSCGHSTIKTWMARTSPGHNSQVFGRDRIRSNANIL